MKLFLVGGFLGSGKTTAIRNAALLEISNGKRVAVITNDQGSDLVDTGFIRDAGIPALEVTEGCFCCNYSKLTKAIADLEVNELPEIIFAEAVGSCTDLVATIVKPFAIFNPEIKVVISVFADAQLLGALIFGDALFLYDNVRYIYKKQLEEADMLVINKIDLIEIAQLKKIKRYLANEYLEKNIVFQNSLKKADVDTWLIKLKRFNLHSKRQSLDMDYDAYAKGEAILGWVDQVIKIRGVDGDAANVAVELISLIHKSLRKGGYPVAHLKFLLNVVGKKHKYSFTSMDKISALPRIESGGSGEASLLLNARVQIDFVTLEELIADCVSEVAEKTGSSIESQKKAGFQPRYPKPEHRMGE